MVWHASLFGLSCSHAAGRAELIVGLRTHRCSGSQTLDAENNSSLRVAVWGAASINRHREGLSKGPRAERKGEREFMEVHVTEEGLLVQLGDAHLC